MNLALSLPRREHERAINVAQLRALCLIIQNHGLTRFELRDRSQNRQVTIDKRIAYLERKELIEKIPRQHVHEAGLFRETESGRTLYEALKGHLSDDALIAALDRMLSLPVESREEPLNVAMLRMLDAIDTLGATNSIELQTVEPIKQRRRNMTRVLEKRQLITLLTRANKGGNTHASWFEIAPIGRSLLAPFKKRSSSREMERA